MISTNKYSNLCIDLDFIHLFNEILKISELLKKTKSEIGWYVY